MLRPSGPSCATSAGKALLPMATNLSPTSFEENSQSSYSTAWRILSFLGFMPEILSGSAFEVHFHNCMKPKSLRAASFAACSASQNPAKALANAPPCNPFAKATKRSCARWLSNSSPRYLLKQALHQSLVNMTDPLISVWNAVPKTNLCLLDLISYLP